MKSLILQVRKVPLCDFSYFFYLLTHLTLLLNTKSISLLVCATNSVKNKTEQIIDGLIKKGADTVILGCTELPIAITDEYYNGIEMINPVDILAKEMLKKELIFKSKI